jgi:hypothetical protein
MADPNRQLPLKPIDQAMQAADSILDHLGITNSELTMISAKVTLDETNLTHIPEEALPILTITKPLDDFAKEALWAYEVTYGMQNGGASRHIIIPKNRDLKARIGPCNVKGDREVTPKDEIELARDLSHIAE